MTIHVGVWFDSQAWGGFWMTGWYRLAKAGLAAIPWDRHPISGSELFRIWSGTALSARQQARFAGNRPEGLFLAVPDIAVANFVLGDLAKFKGLLAREIHPDHPARDGLTSSRVLFGGAALTADEWREDGRDTGTGFPCLAATHDHDSHLLRGLWESDSELAEELRPRLVKAHYQGWVKPSAARRRRQEIA